MIQVQSGPEGRPVVPGGVTAGTRAIWFLRQAANGGWLCVPAAHSGNGRVSFREFPYPVANGALPAALAYDDKSTTLIDRLVLEVAAALRFQANSHRGGRSLIALAGLIESGHASGTETLRFRRQGRETDRLCNLFFTHHSFSWQKSYPTVKSLKGRLETI
jgi:hypothetical protein